MSSKRIFKFKLLKTVSRICHVIGDIKRNKICLHVYLKTMSSFISQYIRTLREQIYEARDMRGVPLLVVGNKQDELSPAAASGTRYRDIVNLVRKHWRCGYVECSARFNCRVVQVCPIEIFTVIPSNLTHINHRPSFPRLGCCTLIKDFRISYFA